MNIILANNLFIRSKLNAKSKLDLWFIHGYGESSLSFMEVFYSKLARSFNLYIPDCPGFGASPFNRKSLVISQTAEILEKLIRKRSKQRKIGLIGHSLGGIIITKLAKKIKSNIAGLVSIEGNLTKADCVYTCKSIPFKSPVKYKKHFLKMVKSLMAKDLAHQRYYASIQFSDPRALLPWGHSCVKETGEELSGKRYSSLPYRKLHLWGTKSTAAKTRKFILDHKLNNKSFPGAGHWLMIDKPRQCYTAIYNFFRT